MQTSIEQTWHFRQAPEVVWEYLTQSALLEKWLGKNDFQPVVGHKFRFISSYGNDSHCEVLEIKPLMRVSFTWQKNSAKDNKPFLSKVVWALTPTNDGTDLHVTHEGFVVPEDIAPHNNGWTTCQKQLSELINSSYAN